MLSKTLLSRFPLTETVPAPNFRRGGFLLRGELEGMRGSVDSRLKEEQRLRDRVGEVLRSQVENEETLFPAMGPYHPPFSRILS